MHLPLRNMFLLFAMLVTAGAAIFLRPTIKMSEQRHGVELDSIIPTKFNGWREEPQSLISVVDPNAKETIDKIYSKTLNRTYINQSGDRIMLSLAYGEDQLKEHQVHKPEVCYPAQGFSIRELEKVDIKFRGFNVPAMRMLALQRERVEPVTYWIVVGNQVVRGSVEQNLARIWYGVQDIIPDGLLFRVSSIDSNAARAYETQREFIDDLMGAIPEESRPRFIGKYAVISQ